MKTKKKRKETYELFMSFASVTSPTELKCSLKRSSDKCFGRFLIISRDLNEEEKSEEL